MSKMINVQDGTYCLIKAYSKETNDSMSSVVKQAVGFMIETNRMQGKNITHNPELLELYNKTFVEKPVNDIEVFRQKILDYISKTEDTKSRITNFVYSL